VRPASGNPDHNGLEHDILRLASLLEEDEVNISVLPRSIRGDMGNSETIAVTGTVV